MRKGNESGREECEGCNQTRFDNPLRPFKHRSSPSSSGPSSLAPSSISSSSSLTTRAGVWSAGQCGRGAIHTNVDEIAHREHSPFLALAPWARRVHCPPHQSSSKLHYPPPIDIRSIITVLGTAAPQTAIFFTTYLMVQVSVTSCGAHWLTFCCLPPARGPITPSRLCCLSMHNQHNTIPRIPNISGLYHHSTGAHAARPTGAVLGQIHARRHGQSQGLWLVLLCV